MTSTEARIAPQSAPRIASRGAPASDPLDGWRDTPRRGRGFSLRTLIVLRWLTILGQSAAVLTASLGLHFPLPLWPCLIVIAFSAAVNVGAMARVRRLEASLPDGRQTAIHLGFDIFQLGVLLALTGGWKTPSACCWWRQ